MATVEVIETSAYAPGQGEVILHPYLIDPAKDATLFISAVSRPSIEPRDADVEAPAEPGRTAAAMAEAARLIASRQSDERGGVRSRLIAVGAFAAVCAIGAVGAFDAGLDRQLNFHDLQAGVTWERAIDKHCWLQFGTNVEGGVEFALRPKLDVAGHNVFNSPIIGQVTDFVKPKWREEMTNNRTTGTVCNDSADMYIRPDAKTGKVHIGFIGKNPFQTIVSPDNFLETQFTPDPNPTAAVMNLEADQIRLVGSLLPDAVKTLPGVNKVYGKSIEDNMKLLLETAALGLTQSACAETAVDESKDKIIGSIVKNVEGQAKQYAEQKHLKYDLPESTYVVDWPKTPVDQDSPYMKQLAAYTHSDKIQLSGQSIESVNCQGLSDPTHKPMTAS